MLETEKQEIRVIGEEEEVPLQRCRKVKDDTFAENAEAIVSIREWERRFD